MNWRPAKPSTLSWWACILAGWAVAVVWPAMLIAVRAQNVAAIDPFFLPCAVPAWLISLALITIGTFRMCAGVSSLRLRTVVTLALLALQVFVYMCVFLLMCWHVHFAAGGHL